MRKWSLALMVFMMLVAAAMAFPGCGSSSPSATVEKFTDALNDRNFDAIYDMSSSSIREGTSREDFRHALETIWAEGTTLSDFEIVSEEINSDRALVVFRARMFVPGMEDGSEASERSVALVQEDGKWKLN